MIKRRKKIFLWTLWHEGQGFGAVTKEIGTPQERRVEINWRTL
jgi:hypothetical protein